MKTGLHRILVAVLAVALTVTMFPLPAFAVDGDTQGPADTQQTVQEDQDGNNEGTPPARNTGQGTKTYAKASGNKKITINKKTCKVTVKKGLKKGIYKVKVKVTAKGNGTHKKATKAVTFKVRIK